MFGEITRPKLVRISYTLFLMVYPDELYTWLLRDDRFYLNEMAMAFFFEVEGHYLFLFPLLYCSIFEHVYMC